MQKNTLAILAVATAMALMPAVDAEAAKKPASAAATKSQAPLSEAARAARDFYERELKGPSGKPGVWVNVESGEITSYSKSGSTYTNHSRTVLADGTIRTALVSESVDDATGVVTITNGEMRYSAEYVRESSDTFRLSYVREPYKDGDPTFLQIFRFVGDRIETTSNGRTIHDVWRSEAAAVEHQTAIAKLRATQVEMKRVQERLTALKAQDQLREMEEGIRRREAEEAEQQAQYARLEGEREAAHAQWEEESRRSAQELEDSLQRLRDSTAEYEAVAKRLTSAQAPASAGNRPVGSNPSGGRGTSERVEASVGTGSDGSSARQGMATGANSESARPGQPLKFKLEVGLEPKPGDKSNPNCVSTLITRGSPGPGWGSSELNSNNASNYAKAQAEVERVKRQFFIACGASGRTVREGDFRWEWNQYSSDQLDRMGAHNREDITVNVP